MKTILPLIVLALACGGSAEDEPDQVALGTWCCNAEQTQVCQLTLAEASETELVCFDARSERRIPLCVGLPVTGDCQRLHYGERGYCNQWVKC